MRDDPDVVVQHVDGAAESVPAALHHRPHGVGLGEVADEDLSRPALCSNLTKSLGGGFPVRVRHQYSGAFACVDECGRSSVARALTDGTTARHDHDPVGQTSGHVRSRGWIVGG